MSVPAWQVTTWRSVRLSADDWALSARALRPLSASVNVDLESGGTRHGQVLWSCDCDGDPIGLAWDWREVRKNVIAMADPMTVVSNLVLTDAVGLEWAQPRRLLWLNRTIHELDWRRPLTQLDRQEPFHRLAA